jgi:hypothetical protein
MVVQSKSTCGYGGENQMIQTTAITQWATNLYIFKPDIGIQPNSFLIS